MDVDVLGVLAEDVVGDIAEPGDLDAFLSNGLDLISRAELVVLDLVSWEKLHPREGGFPRYLYRRVPDGRGNLRLCRETAGKPAAEGGIGGSSAEEGF